MHTTVITTRRTSRGSVWLSWQAPLCCRYSALKPKKYQTLPLKVSNAGGLEQATTLLFWRCIVLLRNNNVPAMSIASVHWNETIHIFEHYKLILHWTHIFWIFLLWQCQLQYKQSCQKPVNCQHTCTNVLLCFGSWQEGIVANHDCSVLQFQAKFICCLHWLGRPS